MQVLGHHAALHRAVDAVASAVTGATDHLGERAVLRAENRSATVVFEAGQSLLQPGQQRFGHHLADGALGLR